MMEYTINTLVGQSGCPVLMYNDIIGIHNAGDKKAKVNRGRIMTPQAVVNLIRWNKELKGDPFTIK